MPDRHCICWFEVDTRRGRVEGFTGGPLEVVTTVLQALRALGVSVSDAAWASAPLLRRSPHRCDMNTNELSAAAPVAAVASEPSARNTNELSAAAPVAAVASEPSARNTNELSAAAPVAAVASEPSARNTNELSAAAPVAAVASEPSARNTNELSAAAPVAAVASEPSARNRSTSEEILPAKQSKTDTTTAKELQRKSPDKSTSRVRGREETEIVPSLLQSSSEDAGKGKKKSPQKKAIVRGKEEAELVKSLLQSSSSEDIVQETQEISDDDKSRREKSPLKPKTVKVRGKEEEKLVQALLHSSSSEDESEQVTKPGPKSAAKPSDNESSSSSESEDEAPVVLVIDDEEVELVMRFLARGGAGEELERFDNDVEYKNRVFHKLNPVVNLERCGPLEKFLTQKVIPKEFARHLGLRSVADVTPEKSVTSDTEKEKANAVQPKRRQLWNRDKEIFNNSSAFPAPPPRRARRAPRAPRARARAVPSPAAPAAPPAPSSPPPRPRTRSSGATSAPKKKRFHH